MIRPSQCFLKRDSLIFLRNENCTIVSSWSSSSQPTDWSTSLVVSSRVSSLTPPWRPLWFHMHYWQYACVKRKQFSSCWLSKEGSCSFLGLCPASSLDLCLLFSLYGVLLLNFCVHKLSPSRSFKRSPIVLLWCIVCLSLKLGTWMMLIKRLILLLTADTRNKESGESCPEKRDVVIHGLLTLIPPDLHMFVLPNIRRILISSRKW